MAKSYLLNPRFHGAAILAIWIAGCSSQFGQQFQDGLAAISGKGGTIARSDQLEETARRAAALRPSQPAPAWETVFPKEAPDFIRFIDEERVLVGAVEVEAYLGVPSFKNVYLYDAREGKTLWQSERPDLVRGQYTVVTTQPLIVIAGSNASATTLLGIDAASGARRWRQDFKTTVAYAVPTDGDRIAVAAREGGALRVTAYALDSGAAVWSRDVPSLQGTGQPRLVSDEQDVYVIGTQLKRVRGSDGAEAWSADPQELADQHAGVAIYPQGLLVWSAKSMALLDRGTGKARWRNAVRHGGIKVIGSYDGQLYRVVTPDIANIVSSPTASDSVEALNLATGTVRWSRGVEGTIVSSLAVDADRVMFAVEDAVWALRARDGQVAYQQRLPATFVEGSPSEFDPPGQPDILEPHGGTLLLSRESAGLLALSLQDGRIAWVQNNNPFPYSQPLRFAMLTAGLAQIGVTRPAAGWAPAYSAAGPNAQLQAHQNRMENLDRMGREASERARVLGSQPGARLDPGRRDAIKAELGTARLAADMRLAETQNQIRSERTQANIQANLELANSLVGLSSAVEVGLKRAAEAGLISRLQLELASADGLHRAAFQSRYHVRPYREHVHQKARGVTLVDVENGRRTDLVFSPTVDAVIAYGLDLPHAAISPSGNRMVVVGVGLRPERYEAYVKGKIRMPRPSLMAYDLASLRYRDPDAQAAGPAQTVDGFSELVAAARKGNTLKVRRLLDRGVDPNPKQVTRFAPIIVAAENGYQDVVALLVKHGANVNYAIGSRSALDFAKDPAVRKILLDAGAKPK